MDFTLAIVGLGGSIALLLWGTHMVQTGIQRAFGPHLRSFLGHALRNRFAALAAGVGITVVLQSSTATCLMAVNFAAGGLVALVPAMAIMLGANVGTALIVTVLSFNVAVLSSPLILAGVMMFRRSGNAPWHDLGRVFIGIGLMLMALHQMISTLEPISNSSEIVTLLSVLDTLPIVAVLLGALAAFAAHSSVAVVLLIGTLYAHGATSFEASLLLVVGANIGTALNPLLEGSGSQNPVAKGLPIANLANRLVGMVFTLAFLPSVSTFLTQWGLSGTSGVAIFHLLFNGLLAALMLPLLDPASRLLGSMYPARIDEADPTRPIYLDPGAREVPSVGLVMAAREALRLADALQDILQDSRQAMTSNAPKQISALKSRDDILDRLNTEIRGYLAGFERDGLSEADERRMHQILTFATNIEQAGDVVEKALLPHLSKRLKRGLLPSQEHQAELVSMVDRLIQNTRVAASLIMSDDTGVARDLAGEKLVFRQAEQAATTNHFSRMRDGITAASQSEGLQVDIIRDMKLINSHIIAAAAYPLLEQAGELLPIRLSLGDAV